MKLNPIMALLDPLEKLITEHGSAAVQTKHIALLKEQFSILEKQNSLLTQNLEKSESKNHILETKNQALTVENQELRKKIQIYEQPAHGANLRDEAKINILKLLFKQDRLTTQQIARHLNLETQTVTFHLEEFECTHMASQNLTRGQHGSRLITWSLAQEGRRYLIENKLTS